MKNKQSARKELILIIPFLVISIWTPAQSPTPPPGGPWTLVFSDEFNQGAVDANRWVVARSSSFPNMGPTNDGDNKLSYLNANAISFNDSVMIYTARKRSGDKYWDTGLITTERAKEANGIGFELRPGDYWETRCKLPTLKGAWMSVWTWGRDNPPGYSGVQPGHGEVDNFEYHWDNRDLLELTNHVRPGNGKYHRDASQIDRGWWITIAVHYKSNTADWYLNDQLIHSDGKGVPDYWRAWLILELAVVAGQYHPAPDHTNPIVVEFNWTRVWRLLPTGVNVNTEPEVFNPLIYPNPVPAEFTVKIPDEIILRETSLAIYGLTGNEVKTVRLHSHEQAVKTEDLCGGLYFYKIINNGETVFRGKIMVQ